MLILGYYVGKPKETYSPPPGKDSVIKKLPKGNDKIKALENLNAEIFPIIQLPNPKPSEGKYDFITKNYEITKKEIQDFEELGLDFSQMTHTDLLEFERHLNRYDRDLRRAARKAVILGRDEYQYCLAEVRKCDLCFSPKGKFKKENQYCLYERISIERSFVEDVFAVDLSQDIAQVLRKEGFDPDNYNLITAATHLALLENPTSKDPSYKKELAKYEKANPVMCFAKRSVCQSEPIALDKTSEEVLSHFGVDPKFLQHVPQD